MTDKRDPRVNPKAGDVLRRGKETRVVERVDMGKARTKCTVVSRPYPWSGYPNTDQWRRWAKDAEVIHAAD